jgi:hypothetical protein
MVKAQVKYEQIIWESEDYEYVIFDCLVLNVIFAAVI